MAAVQAAKMADGATVDEAIKTAIGTIGENMTLRRTAMISAPEGSVASYVHSSVAPGLGKIGVIVGLQSSGDNAKVSGLGRQVAMHVAASGPLAVSVEELDPEVVARERAVYAEQARDSGKPEAIIEKMVEGRMRKFHEEVVLLSQAFVIDTDKTVAQALKDAEADVGGPIEVTAFAVFRLGEGVEKQESDFAAEVAAAAGSN
jgi:elongation factor Ts